MKKPEVLFDNMMDTVNEDIFTLHYTDDELIENLERVKKIIYFKLQLDKMESFELYQEMYRRYKIELINRGIKI